MTLILPPTIYGSKKETAAAEKALPAKPPKGVKLYIDKELYKMIPRPSKQDYAALKLDIEENGLREKIKVFKKEDKKLDCNYNDSTR